jgi:non-heme chloroperoxidase
MCSVCVAGLKFTSQSTSPRCTGTSRTIILIGGQKYNPFAVKSMNMISRYFTTDDDVKLHYIEAGENNKDALILLLGWSQTARQFSAQIAGFSPTHRVIALDPRGHGESEKPESGYRISRFARDLDNLLDHLGVDQANILGQAASCAAILNFIELFGQKRLRSIILVEQMVCYLKQPGWSEDECRNYGAISTVEEVQNFLAMLTGPQGEEATRDFLQNMFSASLPNDKFEETLADSLKLPRPAAAQMLWSVVSGDFRDILSTITVPTLCIGGTTSHLPLECVSWLGSEIPGAEVTLIPGNHSMFLEEPESFNLAVSDFLESTAPAEPMLAKKMPSPAEDKETVSQTATSSLPGTEHLPGPCVATSAYPMNSSLVPDDALQGGFAFAW